MLCVNVFFEVSSDVFILENLQVHDLVYIIRTGTNFSLEIQKFDILDNKKYVFILIYPSLQYILYLYLRLIKITF